MRRRGKICAMLLSAILVVSQTGGLSLFAAETIQAGGRITAFLPLEQSAVSVAFGTEDLKGVLPDTIQVKMELAEQDISSVESEGEPEIAAEITPAETAEKGNGETGTKTEITTAISIRHWIPQGEYDAETPGPYSFTPEISDAFEMEKGLTAPIFTVNVEPREEEEKRSEVLPFAENGLQGMPGETRSNNSATIFGLTVIAGNGGDVTADLINGFTLNQSGTYTITGNWEGQGLPANKKVITVKSGVTANVVLDNAGIIASTDVSDKELNVCAFSIESGADVTLTIPRGKSSVFQSGNSYAAVEVPPGARLTIDGAGEFFATGGCQAAAIGGSFESACGNVTIKGDVAVLAVNSPYIFHKEGGGTNRNYYSGACIGGTYSNKFDNLKESAGEITITENAKVTAYCKGTGAGIEGKKITISGNAEVNSATIDTSLDSHAPQSGCPAIGCFVGYGGEIIITDSAKVTAKSNGDGAAIGCESNSAISIDMENDISITISEDAVVDATATYGGSGIGSGMLRNGGNINILDRAQVTAQGGMFAAGIGGSSRSDDIAQGVTGNGGNITIRGEAVVEATGGDYGAGIGCGVAGNGGNISISGNSHVTAHGGKNGAGIGGGHASMGGNITISGDADVRAYGADYGAGIGAGTDGSLNNSKNRNITITGRAYVLAQGGKYAPGIGNGLDSDSGFHIIVISDNACVDALGGDFGAGIGGGHNNFGGEITIRDSAYVKAIGGEEAAGIGGGSKGSGGKISISDNVYVYAAGKNGADHIGAGSGGTQTPEDSVDITGGIIFQHSDGKVWGNVTLPTTVNPQATLTDYTSVSNGTTLTVPKDVTLTVNQGHRLLNLGVVDGEGTLTGDGGFEINGSGEYRLKVQRTLAKPEAEVVDPTYLTLKEARASRMDYGGDKVEYAVNTDNNIPTDGWQLSRTFYGLNPDTAYTFFARVSGGRIYKDVISSAEIYTSESAKAAADASRLIGNQTYTVSQKEANTAEEVKNWLKDKVTSIPGLSDLGVTVGEIEIDSFLAAETGLSSKPNGTDGSFTFHVPLSKDTAENTAYGLGTITAEVYTSGESGNTGGGGGSSSKPDVATKNGVTTITTSGTVSENTAERALKQAKDKNSHTILVDSSNNKISLPKGMLESMARQTNAKLEVSAKNGRVSIPNQLLGVWQGKFTFMFDDGAIIIAENGKELGDIGVIGITLPYEENQNTGNVAVEIENPDGKKTVIENVYDDKGYLHFEAEGTVSFTILDNYVPSQKPENAPNPFGDIENHWAKDFILEAYRAGLFSGITDDTFEPDTVITRGMMIAVLYRMSGEEAEKSESFTDVAKRAYYASAAAWAAETEIVSGFDDGTFKPDEPITREQLAVMLYGYAKHKGMDVSVGENTNILSFTDSFFISEYAIPAIQWACGSGIMSGRDNGELDPTGGTTRAEAASILIRFLENTK